MRGGNVGDVETLHYPRQPRKLQPIAERLNIGQWIDRARERSAGETPHLFGRLAHVVNHVAEFSQENPADAIDRVSDKNEREFVAVRLPDLIIVDGGKGQLSSACRELQRLGLHDLPIIGLAKEHEEIYRPGRALPLQLPADSGALHLLQRIRDEAHRFANAYHQLLLKKRIDESILDDCPGVSQNRKSLLLRKFGSVNRLRKASVEQIAATEGIGPKLAEEVHRFLQRH